MSSKRQARRNRGHVAQIDSGLAIVVNVIRNLSIHSHFCQLENYSSSNAITTYLLVEKKYKIHSLDEIFPIVSRLGYKKINN